MATDQNTTATSPELNRPLRTEAEAKAPLPVPPRVQKIVDRLEEQVLQLDHVKELCRFIGGMPNYENESNPWPALVCYLDTISDEIDAAACALADGSRGGAS